MANAQVTQALKIAIVIADTIREVGETPSGPFYVMLCSTMPHLTMDSYSMIINGLKHARLVEEKNNVLRWIGPPPK